MNTHKSSNYVRIVYRLVGGVLLCLFSLTVAAPSGAHSGKGSIQIVNREPVGSLTIHYVVEISFVADGHPASEAVATVVGKSAGANIGPVPLAPVAGRTGTYEATVIFPAAGAWDIRVTSLDPTAVLVQTETLEAAVDMSVAPTSVPPVTQAVAQAVTPAQTDPAVTTERVERVPVDVPVDPPVDLPAEPVAAESDRSKSSSRALVVGAVAAGLLGAVAAFWRRRATRSSGRS